MIKVGIFSQWGTEEFSLIEISKYREYGLTMFYFILFGITLVIEYGDKL